MEAGEGALIPEEEHGDEDSFVPVESETGERRGSTSRRSNC